MEQGRERFVGVKRYSDVYNVRMLLYIIFFFRQRKFMDQKYPLVLDGGKLRRETQKLDTVREGEGSEEERKRGKK